jgi:hypothetical protein
MGSRSMGKSFSGWLPAVSALFIVSALLVTAPAHTQTLPTSGPETNDRVAMSTPSMDRVVVEQVPIATEATPADRAAIDRTTVAARRDAAAVNVPAWYRSARNAGGVVTITVNTLAGDDDGICGTDPLDPVQDCSLLEAVALANSNPGASVIAFSVSGTIELSAPVVLLETVHIDGTTAPGGAGSVFLDGQGVVENVVTVSSGVGSVIEGLVIGRSARSGILIVEPAADVSVVGNFIGTNAAGDDLGNDTSTQRSAGVRINGASGTTIGGTAANDGNVIGFGRLGILSGDGSNGTVILGNHIGTNAEGADLGNMLSGVFLEDSTDGTVGGTAPGAGNVIGFNGEGGIIVSGPGATGNVVQGNFVGTDADAADFGNELVGIQIQGASGNTIGGTVGGAGNTTGFNGFGVVIMSTDAAAAGNVVAGNFVGTNAEGADLGNVQYGIIVQNASGNTIGGTVAGAGNTIGLNGIDGVVIFRSTNAAAAAENVVAGNFIGTNAAGADLGNARHGVWVQASGNTIGGSETGAANTVGFSGTTGILIQGGAGNVVAGNYVGTDADGNPLPNGQHGVVLFNGSNNNTIGGAAPGDGNTIGFNGIDGVVLTGSAHSNVILGNFIGTDADGADFGNARHGIFLLEGARDNTIGNTDAGNTIGFNDINGITLSDAGTTGNSLLGNFIGTNAVGDNLGNAAAGVLINDGASDNIVGGAAASEGNTIGFNQHGVILENAATTGNALLGNFIGTNAGGDQNLGNAVHGINIRSGASDNAIGTAGAGNTIGFNGHHGVYLQDAGTTGNTFEDNYIGTNAAGDDLGNARRGVLVGGGASDNAIGTAGAGNTIGFSGIDGVYLQDAGTTGNTFEDNYIGTNAAGDDLGNVEFGVVVGFGASDNAIGTAGAGNTIGFNGYYGVLFYGAGTTGNTFEDNYIGTNAAGDDLGNALAGVAVGFGASDNVIGTAGAGNTIGFNGYGGVLFYEAGTTGNTLEDNYIGTNAAGDDLGNAQFGVFVAFGASDNAIGTAGAGNSIGFNAGAGVWIEGPESTGNAVLGNFIGTNAVGDNLGNAAAGVLINDGASDNIVGGAAASEGNTIGFNQHGVILENATTTGNALLGNFIGTNAGGDQNLGNASHGIIVRSGASDNVIGGVGAGNAIGLNGADGVFIQGAETSGNALLGNYIGTSADGQNLGNTRFGVVVTSGASDNAIGGPGAGNIIGFSGVDGVLFQSSDTTGNVLEGNYIGTNASGENLGNTRHGVLATAGASGNSIGGALPGAGNTIGLNAGTGVLVFDPTTQGNAILGNAIFDNAGLGIDLSTNLDIGDGVTANDGCGDPDTGPNGFQNFPELLSVLVGGSITTIDYDLDTAAGDYRVEFFSVPVADPSGHGEGRTFLGAEQVSVSATCEESFQVELTLAVPEGLLVTATATPVDSAQPSGFGGTSEFSAATAVTILDRIFNDRFQPEVN